MRRCSTRRPASGRAAATVSRPETPVLKLPADLKVCTVLLLWGGLAHTLALAPSEAALQPHAAFFFNFGTVVFWGISTADEQALMHTVVRPCSNGPLDAREVEIDSFSYNYSAVEPPHVQVGLVIV